MKVLGLNCWTLLTLALLVLPGRADAQASDAVMEVVSQQKQSWLVQGGQLQVITTDLEFPQGIKVLTNGMFKVSDRPPRELLEGQRLRSDGWLVGANGSVVPVFDHVTVQKGAVILFRDGVGYSLTQEMTLTNGSRIRPDAMLIDNSGRSTRLIDGHRVLFDGNVLPAKDAISLKQGRVVVQKDGELFQLQPRQTLMMNDGTKVSGDGTVIWRDGKRDKLVEGSTVLIEGTALKLR